MQSVERACSSPDHFQRYHSAEHAPAPASAAQGLDLESYDVYSRYEVGCLTTGRSYSAVLYYPGRESSGLAVKQGKSVRLVLGRLQMNGISEIVRPDPLDTIEKWNVSIVE